MFYDGERKKTFTWKSTRVFKDEGETVWGCSANDYVVEVKAMKKNVSLLLEDADSFSVFCVPNSKVWKNLTSSIHQVIKQGKKKKHNTQEGKYTWKGIFPPNNRVSKYVEKVTI